MTSAQTYSWIFYAAGLASQKLPATFADVMIVADGINHAVPTQKEIRSSVSWSISQGLISKIGKKLILSKEGISLLNDASASSGTAYGVWKYIEKRFSELGVDNSLQINPNTMKTEHGDPPDPHSAGQ